MLGKMGRRFVATGTLLAAALVTQGAFAQEAMKIAAGQRGNWDSSVPEIGERAGIMKKHGLEGQPYQVVDSDGHYDWKIQDAIRIEPIKGFTI